MIQSSLNLLLKKLNNKINMVGNAVPASKLCPGFKFIVPPGFSDESANSKTPGEKFVMSNRALASVSEAVNVNVNVFHSVVRLN